MKRSLIHVVVASAFTLAACSTNRANINYTDVDREIPIKSAGLEGEELGLVVGENGGAIWNSCEEKAAASVREMIASARGKGASAIGNVKWAASGNSEPTCKKSWGMLLIWPLVLTPLFMSSKVTGTAYKVDAGRARKMGLLILPSTEKEEAELLNKIVL